MTNLLKQNDAVFNATVSVLAKREISFEAGMNAKEFVNEDDKDLIIGMVTAGILGNKVTFSDEARAKHTTEAQVKGYVRGMVDNHFRKDKRLNGNTKYATKSPGSRVGSQDEVVKNLRALKSQTTDEDALLEIQAAKPKSIKKVTIDADKIPESLRHLIQA